jgi:hypothetical protein
MSSIFVFGVCALDLNIRVETASREAYDMLLRYIFPPLPRIENPSDSPHILVCVEELHERFHISVDGAEIATARNVTDAVLAAIKALDDAVIKHLTNLYAVHAGAVIIGGRALLIPGSSHAGKSSMVAELLRRGAIYLSDEYALIDTEGMVRPYPRPLLLRNGSPRQSPTLPEEFNACFADGPFSIGWILNLEYEAESAWSVQQVPQSEALLILLENTPHELAESPAMTVSFLQAVAKARCYSGHRGDVIPAANQILKLIGVDDLGSR